MIEDEHLCNSQQRNEGNLENGAKKGGAYNGGTRISA